MIEQIIKHSNQIDKAGYDADKKELHITFKRGAVYIYENVPHEIYIGIVTAPAAGSYFNQYVKDIYKFKKA